MVRFDTFLTSVRDGSILNENNFGLLVYSQEGLCGNRLVQRIIVDNGYFPWTLIVPPFL